MLFNTLQSNLTSGASDLESQRGRKHDTTYLVSELNPQNIDIALNTHGPLLKTLERAVLANDVGCISVSEWLPCAYQSEQESVRDQTALRHRRCAVPQLSLKGPPAKNNEDARSFGKTWVSTKTPTNTFWYRRGRSRENSWRRTEPKDPWERGFCVWCRTADKRSES